MLLATRSDMKPEFVDCFMLIGTALSLPKSPGLPTGTLFSRESSIQYVNVSLTIQDIQFINLPAVEIRVETLLHQRWIDPSLGVDRYTTVKAARGQIWRPKITVTKGTLQPLTEDTQFWRGYGEEGNVLLSEKIQIRTQCTRNFKKFPFDSQICELKFGTYRFPSDEVTLQWHPNPVEILHNSDFNEFKLTNLTVFHEIDVRASGNFSVLMAQVVFTRFYYRYVLCTMFPCGFLVFLSYLCLWISHHSLNLRLGLLFIILIVLLYFYHVSSCFTMPVPYIKSLDAFIILCLTFANLALIETYTVMLNPVETVLEYPNKEAYCKKSLNWIETTTKVSFPLFFVTCVLFYLYSVILPNQTDKNQ